MSYKTNSDNKYKEGTLIFAKSHPDVQLKIIRYYHRTYYCAIVGEASEKSLEYFEHELLAPTTVQRRTADEQ
jgi:hypothetical protein